MSRNKKYNPMEAAKRAARVGLRNLAVFHSQRDNQEKYTAHVVNTKNGSDLTVGQSMAFAICKIRHKWNVHLLAIGEDTNGKNYFKCDEVAIT